MKHKLLLTMFAFVSLICGSTQAQQWQLQTTLSGNPVLTSVKAVSRDVAWTCSFYGSVYRTTDGGETWNPTAKVTTSQQTVCIEALDATTAFVSGSYPARIYRTTNGGQNWQIVYSEAGAQSSCNWIHFFDALNGIAQTDDPYTADHELLILKTADGGTTWVPLSNIPVANALEVVGNNCFHFYDKLNGWFGTFPFAVGGSGGRVFRTTDGGSTWTGVASGTTEVVTSVRFISSSVGIRTSFAPQSLTRSVDGGQTWTPVNNLPISNINLLLTTASINNARLNQVWVAGEAGSRFILSSIDGGASWQQQAIVGTVQNAIFHMSAVKFGARSDSVQIWAITVNLNTFASGGEILSYRNPIGVVTSVKERAQLPTAYALSQNYPNPFNPSTTIRYELPQARLVTLKIFNVQGQELAALVHEKQTAGEHAVSWNAAGLPSGVYLYRLQAGDWVETKKMILAK